MTATTPNPWLSRLAGKTSEEMATALLGFLAFSSQHQRDEDAAAIADAIEAIQALERERAGKLVNAIEMFLNCDAFIPTVGKQSADDQDHERQRREDVTRHIQWALDSFHALSPAAQGKSGGEG